MQSSAGEYSIDSWLIWSGAGHSGDAPHHSRLRSVLELSKQPQLRLHVLTCAVRTMYQGSDAIFGFGLVPAAALSGTVQMCGVDGWHWLACRCPRPKATFESGCRLFFSATRQNDGSPSQCNFPCKAFAVLAWLGVVVVSARVEVPMSLRIDPMR